MHPASPRTKKAAEQLVAALNRSGTTFMHESGNTPEGHTFTFTGDDGHIYVAEVNALYFTEDEEGTD